MTTEMLFKPAAPLNEIADRLEKREPFYIGGLAIIDPPLLRLVDRDAVVSALRRAAILERELQVSNDAHAATGKLLADTGRALEAERERCAKIVESYDAPYVVMTNTGSVIFRANLQKIAAAIRATPRVSSEIVSPEFNNEKSEI